MTVHDELYLGFRTGELKYKLNSKKTNQWHYGVKKHENTPSGSQIMMFQNSNYSDLNRSF